MEGKIYSISLGGSLLMNSKMEFNLDFIREFKNLIKNRVEAGDKFIFTVGGGKTARFYQTAGRGLGFNQEQLDRLGVKSTYVNAELVRLALEVEDEVYYSPEDLPKELSKSIYICSGWKPGWSTDYVATFAANHIKSKYVVNLSNTDYIYDSDPDENPEAQKLEKLTWVGYHKMIGVSEWSPGIHVPFDPIASRLAMENNMTLFYLNGHDLNNLKKFFDGEDFVGST